MIRGYPESKKYRGYAEYRGGAREGAGRKAIGETRRIAVTLTADTWAWMDECIENGHAQSRSELLREIIKFTKGDLEWNMKRK